MIGVLRKTALASIAFSLRVAVSAAPVQTCTTMVITGADASPPLSWRDRRNTTDIVGVGFDMVKTAMKDAGVPVTAKYLGNWKRAQVSVGTGQADAIVGVYLTEERKAYLDYVTPPFIMDESVLFVRKNDSLLGKNPMAWSDHIGLPGSAVLGNSFGDKFDAYAKKHLAIEWAPNEEAGFKKLAAGRSRYFIYGLYPGLVIAENLGARDDFTYVKSAVISEGMYIAFSKKSPCLKHKDYLAQKIGEYVKEDRARKLLEKYLSLWREQASLPKPE